MLFRDEKREMQERASSNFVAVGQRSERQETKIARSETLLENPYYEELKPISDEDKEYDDEHENDREILRSMIVTKLVPRARKVIMWNHRSASEFSEIYNGKVLFVTKYKVAFSILTVISYDSVVLTLIAEN